MKKLIGFVLVVGICGASWADDTSIPRDKNICYTENIEINKGTSFPVKVFVNNIDTLAGMQVPIYYRSENVSLTCDSVTFGGSRCAHFGLSDFKIEPKGKTVYFAFIYMVDPNQEVAPLLPGDGQVATIWFTAPPDAKTGALVLESGPNAFLPNPRIDYGYHFWTPMALEIDFEFMPGTIKIK